MKSGQLWSVLTGVNVVMAARGAEALETTAARLRAERPAGARNQILTVAADVTTEAGRAA